MARTTVIVHERWHEFEEQIDRRCVRALGKATAVGVAVARANETKVRTGKTRASIRALGPVKRTRRGFSIAYGSTHFVARFVESGTRARKGAAKTARTKARRQAAGITHSGVRGIHFLRRSAKDAKIALEASLREGLG